MFWFWFFVGPALLLSILALRGERARADYVAGRLAGRNESYLPPVTLIVPVKGDDEGLRENLASLALQDYPDYELIVAARCARDIPSNVLPSGVKIALSGDIAGHASEKILNLEAGIATARNQSQVLAFADSDGRVSSTWLRALVAPLRDDGVGASTGYRWHVPEPPAFWSLLRSVWNAPIAGILGAGPAAFAWGGAMAIRKETFFEAQVPEFWKAAVSDDYALTAAIRRLGLRIAFEPGAMVAATDHISGRGLFAWTRRQMLITRVYSPRLWWAALIGHVFYCGGMAASVVASIAGHRGAEWALVVQLGLGMLKGANRATLARAELPSYDAWFRRHGWVHTLWVPLATWIWLWAVLASAFGNEIEWRGRRYILK